ncbi:MAG: hypothetical protein FWH33_11460, partial [Oscillospiraceae bacterium]|nr:hypothetical protein [Oscillospiraceae bacterium]
THFVALPLPKKPYGFSGAPCKEAERCETEARMPHLSTNEAKKTSAQRKGVNDSILASGDYSFARKQEMIL